MSATLSKRQQARNEKVLQDLVQTVPGNNVCADCQTRNPAWASWNSGIFLCMRCASLHRKLGTHISKVKSLSMDSWSSEQVENMKRIGNNRSNQKFASGQVKKPTLPVDSDEADSVMERFIRQKYVANTSFSRSPRRDSGSMESDDDTPPPPPPKPNSTHSKISFRSASNIFPLSSKAKREAALRTTAAANARASIRSPSPKPPNKPSKVFGASVEYDASPDDTERKLVKLRDMGFSDAQRNAMVLKGVNGNLERAIGTLVRLGEAGRNSPVSSLASPRESSLRATRSMTPMTPTSVTSQSQAASQETPGTPSTVSNDPWDMPPAQPQSSQSTGTLQSKNPYAASMFGEQGQPGDLLNHAFQTLSLAPPQPLFPNHTGGFTNQQTFQQPDSPSQGYQHQLSEYSTYSQYNGGIAQPQPLPPQGTMNPFFVQQGLQQPSHMSGQPQISVNTAASPAQNSFTNNPFTRSPTRMQSPSVLGQIPEQSQPNFYAQPPPLSQPQSPPSMQAPNPFTGMPQQPSQPMMQQMYMPQRPDKASILALYNYPHLAPQQLIDHDSSNINVPPAAQQPRSVSTPLPGSNNPFLSSPTAIPSPAPAAGMPGTSPFANGSPAMSPTNIGHVNGGGPTMGGAVGGGRQRDSLQLGMELAWTNGRHSPDAFASLSARHV